MISREDGRPSDAEWYSRVGIVRSALAMLVALLLVLFARNCGFYALMLAYPFEIDYGEGIVWQQMRDMMNGTGYGPLATFPAIVYHYPPVFHLMTGTIAAITGGDELAVGRGVSLAATLVTAGLVAALVAEVDRSILPRSVRVIAGIIAALLFLDMDIVIKWTMTMRVDTLAGAFSLLGILMAIRALERPNVIYGAALAFVLSIYTKQTMIAAPAAAFAVLLFVHPALAWRGIATSVGLGMLLGAIALWETEGRFFQHIVLYNVNSINMPQLPALVAGMPVYSPILVVGAIGAWRGLTLLRPLPGETPGWGGLRARLAVSPAGTAMAMLLLFLTLRTAMLPMIIKSGSSSNYLLEWLSAVCIFAGIAIVSPVATALRVARPPVARPTLLLLGMLIAGIPIQFVRAWPQYPTSAQLQTQAARLDKVAARIAASPRPVLSDDMTLLIRAGRKVEWEPAIVAELIRVGRYDEKPLLRMIAERRFGFFITHGVIGDPLFDGRYTPATARAMASAYPRLEHIAGLTLHLPPEPAR